MNFLEEEFFQNKKQNKYSNSREMEEIAMELQTLE